MSSHDVLCYAFTFLDYSYVRRLCLVCKEWNMIASSNQLWEFYFRILSNKRTDKISVPTETITEGFWKKKMKDHFSKYTCRNSKRVSPKYGFAEILKGFFPNHFTSQVVRMILSRIYLDSLWTTTQLDKPFRLGIDKDEDYEEYVSYNLHFKMDMKISGIAESIIVRWCITYDDIGLFGYPYNRGYYLYFAKESDDKLNMEQVKKHADFEQLGICDKAFVYKFHTKDKPGSIHGKEYLVREILDFLVPTVKSFEMSPVEFIPYWCFLFGLLISRSDFIHKEFSKCFPNLISNPLVFNIFKSNYGSKVRPILLNLSIVYNLPCFPIPNKTEQNLNNAIKNKQVDSFKLDSENKGRALEYMKRLLGSLEKNFAKYVPTIPRLNETNEIIEFNTNANYLADLYRLITNYNEYMGWFLKRKFKC